MKIDVKAYAKINLFLDIESLREDGYHNILSLMQSVTLHDNITVEYIPSEKKEILIECDIPSIPCDSSNLAYKAADLYPTIGSIRITIEKRIPISAGLAGGSADAAAVLLALNSLAEDPMTLDELKALGNRLGADVPFCIEQGACIAKGTGDILIKTAAMPMYPIVIARKGDGMSTPEAYRALDKKYNKFSDYTPKNELLQILSNADNSTALCNYTKGFFNIFESVVETCRPAVSELKEIMTSRKAACAMMSGSGTSVFGVFENEDDAIQAINALIDVGAVAHLCYPMK